MRLTLALLFLALVPACLRDETLSHYGAQDHIWVLTEINGAPASGTRLAFARFGRLQGTLPCGSVSARVSLPYPWFALERLRSPETCANDAHLRTLSEMTLVEIAGQTLLLTDDDGARMMVFKAAE